MKCILKRFQTIGFTRKIVTTDKVTDFPLNKCYHFLFPVGGGRVLARKSQDFKNAKTPIGYHDKIHPESSPLKICICDKNGAPIGTPDNKPTPPRVRARRAAASSPSTTLGCSDVALLDVVGHDESSFMRVVDGFSLSGTTINLDEAFSGVNSIADVSALSQSANGSNSMIVRFRKPLAGVM